MANLALAFDILARDRASKAFDNVGNSAERAGKKGHAFGGVTKAAVAGVVAASAGLFGVGVLLAKSVGDARESQRIGRLTAQVIKSTGGAAKITAGQVSELATAVSNKTGIDDEAIQSGENLLLTFTNVRNEVGKGNDIFNQATATIADMSAALGQDTKSSAIQLGKALNDPIKGVTALQRVGVSFTKSQKDQIKTLVDSGKTLDAQKLILHELGREFGGAAAAASTPMDKLKVTLGNVSEEIGGFLIPVVDGFAKLVMRALPPVMRIFGDVADVVRLFIGSFTGKGADAMTAFGETHMNGIIDAGARMRVVFDKVSGAVQSFAGFLGREVIPRVTALGNVIVTQLLPPLIRAYQFVAKQAIAGFRSLAGAIERNKPQLIALGKFLAVVAGVIATKVAPVMIRLAGVQIRILITAVGAVITVFGRLMKVGASIAVVLIPIFRFLLDAFLTMAGGIIHGAAKAFGWVKGVGGKLKSAARGFDSFKSQATGALDAAERSANQLRDSLNGIPRNINITVRTRYDGDPNVSDRVGRVGRPAPERALGGPVTAGNLYTVNERGQELFVPAQSGRILSHRDSVALLARGGTDAPVHVAAPVVHVYLDSQKIAARVDTVIGGRADRLSRGG